MLSAKVLFKLSNSVSIRSYSPNEAEMLSENVRKRNVFARHSRENSFYLYRANALAGHTVLEIFLPGDPKSIRENAEKLAAEIERVVVISSILAIGRKELLRKLGIGLIPTAEFNYIFSQDFQKISSKAQVIHECKGLTIDETFVRRFTKCGFVPLATYLQSHNDLSTRVSTSIKWLFDSRAEPRLEASFVKTSIALESLLIFNDSESLAQSLSERAAFILSQDPARRLLISRILKRFYDVRSGIVHGSKKSHSKLSPGLLEIVDRLAVLLILVIARNSEVWPNPEDLRLWCESQRWGAPSRDIAIPFPDIYLRRTMEMTEKEFS